VPAGELLGMLPEQHLRTTIEVLEERAVEYRCQPSSVDKLNAARHVLQAELEGRM